MSVYVRGHIPPALLCAQVIIPMLIHSPVSPPRQASLPHLDTARASLTSPRDMSWDNHCAYSTDTMDPGTWNYYTLPPSPPASVSSNTDDSPQPGLKSIRPCFTPDLSSENEQQSCLPTSQVFDVDTADGPSSPSSASPPPPITCQLTLSSENGASLKRSFTTIGMKKGRGSGERITTKDFVPPDVTGLSKREARLLKNRAAAFLSRQRKREEFEAMEIRVRELEEENLRLQALAERGKKYDDLLQNMEQLRLRLSIAEKREREITAEIANRTTANLVVKTESHDLGIPLASYSSYVATGQTSVAIMKQSLLSSLPSLLSVPPQTPLPITLSVPLTGSGSSRPSTSPFSHSSATCDGKNQSRPRFDHGSIGFHPNSADVEPSKKMAIGGEHPEARPFEVDGHHCLASLVISLDASPTEDGRGCVRVHVSERTAKAAKHGNKPKSPSLPSWPGSDASFAMTCFASSPLSASVNNLDYVGIFAGTGSPQSRMDFDTQVMSSGYTPLASYDQEPAFEYYPGLHLE